MDLKNPKQLANILYCYFINKMPEWMGEKRNVRSFSFFNCKILTNGSQNCRYHSYIILVVLMKYHTNNKKMVFNDTLQQGDGFKGHILKFEVLGKVGHP